MALTLVGKPGNIPYSESIAADYSTLAKGRCRAFKHPKSFDVAVVPNSDRKVSVGGASVAGYGSPGLLNRVGEDGLMGILPAAEEIQLDAASTSARWDILAIQVANADLATGTATLVILKGTEGNVEGATTVTLNGAAVNWTNTANARIWPIRNLRVTPGQQAVTIGGSYHTFAGRLVQFLDKTPPDNTAAPAGSAFIDSTGVLNVRSTDANGNITNRNVSGVGIVTRTASVPSYSWSGLSSAPLPTVTTDASPIGFLVTNASGTTSTPARAYRTENGAYYVANAQAISLIDVNTKTSTYVAPTGCTYLSDIAINASGTKAVVLDFDGSSSYTQRLIDFATRTVTTLQNLGSNGGYTKLYVSGDNFFYALGGSPSSSFYRLYGTSWSSTATPPIALNYSPPNGLGCGGKIFFAHPSSANAYLVYDVNANSWSNVTSPSGSLSGKSFTVFPQFDPANSGVLFWCAADQRYHRVYPSSPTSSSLASDLGTREAYAGHGQPMYGDWTTPEGYKYNTAGNSATNGYFTNAPYVQLTANATGFIEPVDAITKIQNVTKGGNWANARTLCNAGDVIRIATSPKTSTVTITTFEMGGV